mmetsp:Transcript_8586/g.7611  ORF Transcript_8586/g.7611 Transcript_8586/m.7611 type:complete len:391 (+) Transcript_8586:390-1562(+)
MVEQVEKKEFTLQLLEQRLFDCEKFLRKWGREDPFVREQLKFLKINPDLKKKKITNVVEENTMLKKQLKESLDEIELLHQKVMKMSKSPNETTFLKDSIIHNRSRIDMFMANEMFGDDCEPINEESKEEEITNLATQASTKRNKGQDYGADSQDVRRKLKIKRNNVETALEPFEGKTYHQIAIDLNKIKSIKEAYPEEYQKKLESAQMMLQKTVKTLQKELNESLQANVYLKDQVDIYKTNYEKVLRACEKYKQSETLLKESIEKDVDSIFENTPRDADPIEMRAEIEAEFKNIRSQTRRSNMIETFKKVDETIEKFQNPNKMSRMFNELSSIIVEPGDLPKNFKAFATETIDEKTRPEINIPSTMIKKTKTSKKLTIKNSMEVSRRGNL